MVFASARRAKHFYAGHFSRETDTTRAMNAACHVGFDERPKIFVGDRAFVFLETRMVEPVGHRLVLKIALAALIADRAVQRMIDQQEFHYTVTGILDRLGIGLNDHAVADGHRTGSDRFRRTLHFHETHAAVTGNRKPLVVAETGDFNAGLFAGLEDRYAVLDLDLGPVNYHLCHEYRSLLRPRCESGLR